MKYVVLLVGLLVGACATTEDVSDVDQTVRRKPKCDYSDPTVQWVSKSAHECDSINFICPSGYLQFWSDCGCGCTVAPPPTCEPAYCLAGYYWDAATCACVQSPGEVCGAVTCPVGEVCCNASCGICTPVGGTCTPTTCTP